MSDAAAARIEVEVRRAGAQDAPAMRDYAIRNERFLARWEPLRPPDFFDVERIAARLGEPDRVQFLAIHDEHVVGQVALSNFSRAPVYLNCTVGYSVDEHHQGVGVATAMVRHAVREAFVVEGMHRVEAGTLLENVGSQRVLEKSGFTRIGVSPRHVKIAGRWQDHVLFATTVEDLGDHA